MRMLSDTCVPRGYLFDFGACAGPQPPKSTRLTFGADVVRLPSFISSGPADLIAWKLGGNGPGNFLGKWESDRFSPGPLSVELFAQKFQQADPFELAREIRQKAESVMRKARVM